MSGIDATLFFTFWGLDIITKKTVDRLHVPTVGNPSMRIPTMVGGLPGMETLATTMMQKQMEKLDIPSVHELIEILSDSGARLYACRMAMDMFKRTRADLVPQVEDVISDGLLRQGGRRAGAVHLAGARPAAGCSRKTRSRSGRRRTRTCRAGAERGDELLE